MGLPPESSPAGVQPVTRLFLDLFTRALGRRGSCEVAERVGLPPIPPLINRLGLEQASTQGLPLGPHIIGLLSGTWEVWFLPDS